MIEPGTTIIESGTTYAVGQPGTTYPVEQPRPTINAEIDCQTLLMERIADEIPLRRQLGIDRYGTALQALNGRNSLRDLWEELMDASTYFMQVEVEFESLVDHLFGIVTADTADEANEWKASAALLLLKLNRWDGELRAPTPS